jgi:hypothetical protein
MGVLRIHIYSDLGAPKVCSPFAIRFGGRSLRCPHLHLRCTLAPNAHLPRTQVRGVRGVQVTDGGGRCAV